ncbi:polymorphic toxin type 24 domain-containing protein, partial [Providencia rettgeri]|uniref:polymorphic toxin type 24 domain-containing protein n=1 Tax=Providencia rettgeri TaxID=587 RepID=UPI00235F9DD4
TSSAANAAEAGKTTVENNYLSSQNVVDMKKELEDADKTGADKTGIYDKYGKISKENRDKAIAEIESGGSFDAIGVWSELNAGVNVADALKISALFDDLSSEDRAQLVNFVKAESAESAQAIYDSLSITAKGALLAKEAGDSIGIGGAIPGSGVSVAGIKGKGDKGNKEKEQNNSSGGNTPSTPNSGNNQQRLPRNATNLVGGPLERAQQVSGRFQIEGGPKNGTVYRADNQGNITSYATYDSNGMITKRVDVTGAAHGGVATPHVIEYGRNVLPNGQVRVQSPSTKALPRPVREDEIP